MVTEVNFKLGITAEELIKADKLIAEINDTTNNHEINPDDYWDCLAEDIDFSRAEGELAEVIDSLLDLQPSSKVRKLIIENSSCELGNMYVKCDSINAMPVGELEFQFTELDELSDAAYAYVRKNIDAYLSDTRTNLVYNNTSDWVHLIVDVDALTKEFL